MNVAHFLTLMRIVLIPLFPVIYLGYGSIGISEILVPYFLLIILAICEISDLIDGYWARKKGMVTDLGKVLDPMADSITHIAVFFTFSQGWVSIPILLVFVFLYREFLINTLRTLCALKNYALAARKSGKAKSVIQAVVSIFIVILMIPYTLGYLSLSALRLVSLIAISLSAVYTIITAVEYMYVNKEYIIKSFERKKH